MLWSRDALFLASMYLSDIMYYQCINEVLMYVLICVLFLDVFVIPFTSTVRKMDESETERYVAVHACSSFSF